MARSAIYFGINAFGEIATTKIALCHQHNCLINSLKETDSYNV